MENSNASVQGGFDGLRILVFDNYDSFTYNLVHLVEKITHQKVDVYRNDEIPLPHFIVNRPEMDHRDGAGKVKRHI